VSRTRLIRPEFFSDGLMARLSVGTRLFYIGLWTLCDDVGYFELDVPQIGAELFRFDGPARRQKAVAKALEELVAVGRVRYLDCGEHGIVPTIPDHRIKGGEALYTVKKRHDRRCTTSDSVGPTEDYLSVSVSDSDSESVSLSAQARTKKRLMAAFRRQGLPVETT
jgi:hypothetical protein